MCIPLADKYEDTVVNAYLKDTYCRFGGSKKTLSGNGSEFKNSLFSEVATHLGIKHLYSSPCRCQVNRWIKASHNFPNTVQDNLQ